jgi:hypothetical protein
MLGDESVYIARDSNFSRVLRAHGYSPSRARQSSSADAAVHHARGTRKKLLRCRRREMTQRRTLRSPLNISGAVLYMR